jgi:hypothetical protein
MFIVRRPIPLRRRSRSGRRLDSLAPVEFRSSERRMVFGMFRIYIHFTLRSDEKVKAHS